MKHILIHSEDPQRTQTTHPSVCTDYYMHHCCNVGPERRAEAIKRTAIFPGIWKNRWLDWVHASDYLLYFGNAFSADDSILQPGHRRAAYREKEHPLGKYGSQPDLGTATHIYQKRFSGHVQPYIWGCFRRTVSAVRAQWKGCAVIYVYCVYTLINPYSQKLWRPGGVCPCRLLAFFHLFF